MANPVLQLLITARDDATSAFKKLFSFLDSEVSVVAGKIRDAFTGLFGGGLDGAMEFEAQLDRVQAKGSYTAEQMQTLKANAEEVGRAFGITGTEAAQGMEALAAAGLTTEEVIAALPPVLALAAAEGLSMDDASAKLANSLTTVGLGFSEAGRLADVLTQAANESTTSASAVAAALETAGGIAKTAGLTFEQTAAALTGLAKGGIEGERAGTALAAIFTQLLNPASNASKELNKLGITSRDLGTVIGELQQQGPNAGAAILAFGETAGPGLRSLIGQGQQSLLDLEQAMLSADGAAQNAADQMKGNLKGALNDLVAAWDNLKTALFEPVLEPLAQAANDASTALNDNLREGALKPVQEAIKSFVENGIQAARDFIAGFDFKASIAAIQDFAKSASESFTAIKDTGQTAADVVTVAWNALTAGFKTIGAALLGTAASIMGNLASIESAAAKIGLGSIERADALNAKALAMKATATELLNQVATDGREMGVAFDRLAGVTDTAATAQQNLKDALPVAEIQTITYALGDYQRIADKANAAAAIATAEYNAGKISAAEYGQKILAAAEANAQLEAETRKQTAATTDSTAAKKDAVDQSNRLANEFRAEIAALEALAKEAVAAANAQGGLITAQKGVIEASIELARVEGREADVKRLLIDLARNEANQATNTARVKNLQAEAAYKVLAAEEKAAGAILAAGRSIDEVTQKRLDSARIAAETAGIEAAAAGQVAEAERQKAAATALGNVGKKDGTDANQKNTEATNQNTQATDKNAKAADGAAKSGGGLAEVVYGLIGYWRQQTGALSEATQALFELKAGLSDGIDIGLMGDLSDEAAKAVSEIDKATASIRALEQQMLYSTGSVGYFMDKVQKAGNEATKAYYEQKLAAEALEEQINNVGVKTVTRFGTTTAAIHGMTDAVEITIGSLDLLNDQDLDKIRAALDSANDKLREMQEETQSARERLAELNAEILEAQGQDQQAELLRQQLDYQQQLAEVQKQRQDAELMGNRELIALLNEQESKLSQLNRLKIANINAEADSSNDAIKTANTVRNAWQAVGDTVDAVNQKAKGMDFSRAVTQSSQLRTNFNDLNALL